MQNNYIERDINKYHWGLENSSYYKVFILSFAITAHAVDVLCKSTNYKTKYVMTSI